MKQKAISIDYLPKLKNPVMILGFDGWGNAMNISKGMAVYLTRKLNGKKFAQIDPDMFYRYDGARPMVQIELGRLEKFVMPGGDFYAIQTKAEERDLVVLDADEPNLNWNLFQKEIIALCRQLGIDRIISIGSMYDNVLHTDLTVSGILTDKDLIPRFAEKGINLIYYQGPSAIHAVLHHQLSQHGLQGISLWCHCPYYLQETVHFGLLAHLGKLLAYLGEFSLDTGELENSWQSMSRKIETMIQSKPEIQSVVAELQKAKAKDRMEKRQTSIPKNGKVIDLKDFMNPDI